MFRFFSKIRKSLLDEGKAARYTKYAIGEIFLVVIGILIALQINNWNEQRVLDARTQDYYLQLLDDLNSDKLEVIKISKIYQAELKQYQDYLSLYDTKELEPKEAFDHLFKLPIITRPFTFSSNTFDTLQSSADIVLLPASIRNNLANLKRTQELSIIRYEQVNNGKNSLVEKLNPYLGSTTLIKRLERQPSMKEFFNIEGNFKELILIYEGIHRWREVWFYESIEFLNAILSQIDALIIQIEEQIEHD